MAVNPAMLCGHAEEKTGGGDDVEVLCGISED